MVLTKGPNSIIGERHDMEESLIGKLSSVSYRVNKVELFRPRPWPQQPVPVQPATDRECHSECV